MTVARVAAVVGGRHLPAGRGWVAVQLTRQKPRKRARGEAQHPQLKPYPYPYPYLYQHLARHDDHPTQLYILGEHE